MPARQGLFEDLMDLGYRVPPRVGTALAAISWLIFLVIALQTRIAAGTTPAGGLSQAVIHIVATWLEYGIPFCLMIGVSASLIRRRRAKKILSAARVNPQRAIAGMGWRDFEDLVGEYFRQKGYEVLTIGGNGPDGGVDLVLNEGGKRYLVQCKHWKAWKVGVSVVRELKGVIATQRADGGYVITGGHFTRDAEVFAHQSGITLIDGIKLEELVKSVGRVPAAAATKPVAAVAEAPNCPDCGAPMRERVASQGEFKGQPFWGCSTYPKCGAIVHIERVA